MTIKKKHNKRMMMVALWLLGFCAVAIGIIAFFEEKEHSEYAKYGRVTEGHVIVIAHILDSYGTASSTFSRGVVDMKPRTVTYEYEVNNTTYTNTTTYESFRFKPFKGQVFEVEYLEHDPTTSRPLVRQ